MVFLLYPHVSKENSMAATVRWDNRCVTDRASYIICRAQCKMKCRTSCSQNWQKAPPRFCHLSLDQPWCFHNDKCCACLGRANLTALPHSWAHMMLCIFNHPIPRLHPVPSAVKAIGPQEQLPECVPGGTRVAPPEARLQVPHTYSIVPPEFTY